jgi:hypothetical protein
MKRPNWFQISAETNIEAQKKRIMEWAKAWRSVKNLLRSTFLFLFVLLSECHDLKR